MTTLNPAKHARPFAFFLATNRKEVKWYALTAFCYSSAVTSMLVATYYVGRVIDIIQSSSNAGLRQALIIIVLGMVGYEIGFRIGHIIENFAGARMRAATKKALFNHVASLSFSYFADRFSGQLAHKVSATTDAIELMVATVTNQFVEDGLMIIISAAGLLLISPDLSLFLLLWGILFSLGTIPFGIRMNARASDYADQESRTTGVFVDFFTNIGAVKVYGRKSNHEALYAQIEAERKSYLRLGYASILSKNYVGVSITLLGTGFIVMTSMLYLKESITIGGIVFVAAVALRIFSAAWELGQGTSDFIRKRGEAQQNLKDLIATPTVFDGATARDKADAAASVEYQDVTFGYGGRPVLKNFSFVVPALQKVGIVGLSGAGKTTFANLLLRFFDVENGAVLLNGVDIRELSQEYLRSHISYISQDTSLFHTTIAENIAYGLPGASPAAIEEAARLAYADDFITALPEGYDSVVGERGIKLSGGQRQRIAIARAILADRPLFLLDEATSALDSDSEAKIQKGLATLMEGKTVIAIAHRLSTLSHLDRIIYLEGGRIIEDGTHEELLSKGGKYAALWQMQAGGFLPADGDLG